MEMVTLKDVAAAASVSTVTASSVLSGVNRVRVSPATAERIHRIAREMNYVPLAAARGLRTGKTRIIAFVSSSAGMFSSDDMWHESLRGVSDIMWEREERLMLVMSKNREHELETIRQMAYGRQVDGFIIQHSSESADHVAMLQKSGRPFVIMGGTPRADANTVSFDMRSFAADIADTLGDCGGILLMLPRSHAKDPRVHAPFLEYFAGWEREKGVRCRVWEKAFVPDAAWLAEFRAESGGGRVGVALLRGLLPEMANSLESAGLAPETDSRIAYVSTGEDVLMEPTGMSIMHFDNYTLGRRAARLLMGVVDRTGENPGKPENLIIPAAQRG